MKIFIALFALAFCCFANSNIVNRVKETPKYDMYVFAIQWATTMCLYTPGCTEKMKPIPKNEMSIHGLWPNLKSGKRLPDCHTGPEILIGEDDFPLTMKQYWPSLVKSNTEFWTHEYNKHGYCYSVQNKEPEPSKYFENSLKVFFEKEINMLIIDILGTESKEVSIPLPQLDQKIQNQIGGKYYSLTCKNLDGKQYLLEIRFTLDLDFNYMVSKTKGSCNTKKPVTLIFE